MTRGLLKWCTIGYKLNDEGHKAEMIWWCSVQFSCSVMSDSLRSHESQRARLSCPSPTPRVYSNSCPLSRWCHTTISSSVTPFSSCPQSFPASGSFPMSQLFASGGQGIGVSASASVLPVNTQDWSPLGWTGWISLQSKGLSSLLQHHRSKASILQRLAFFTVQLLHPYTTTGKTIALTRWTFDWSDGSQSKWKRPWIRSLIKVTGRSLEREGYGWRTRCLK